MGVANLSVVFEEITSTYAFVLRTLEETIITGSARGSAANNLSEYTAYQNNKKLPKHLPRPRQTPNNVASSPKWNSQLTYLKSDRDT